MADPFSITASAVALLGTVATLTVALRKFNHDFRDAFKDIADVQLVLSALQHTLESLNNQIEGIPDGAIAQEVVDQVTGTMSSCNAVIKHIHTVLQRYKPKATHKLKWIEHGRSDIRKLGESLRGHQCAFKFALFSLHLFISRGTHGNTCSLLDDTQVIKSDLEQVKELLRLRQDLETMSVRTQDSYLMNRFLDTLTVHTVSVCSPSELDLASEGILDLASNANQDHNRPNLGVIASRRGTSVASVEGKDEQHKVMPQEGLSRVAALYEEPSAERLLFRAAPSEVGHNLDNERYQTEESLAVDANSANRLATASLWPAWATVSWVQDQSGGAEASMRSPDAVRAGTSIRDEYAISESQKARQYLLNQERLDIDRQLRSITSSTTAAELQKLLDDGADPNISDDGSSQPALWYACKALSLPCMRLLLQYGADPLSYPCKPAPWEICTEAGLLDGVSLFLENLPGLGGADLSAITAGAVTHGNLDIIKLAMRNGAIPTNTDMWNAVKKGDIDIVRFFLRHGLEPSTEMLISSTASGHMNLAELLLKCGAIPNESFLDTLLIRKDAESLRFAKGNIRAGVAQCFSALDRAVSCDNLEMVKVLLESGYKPTITTLQSILEREKYGSLDSLDLIASSLPDQLIPGSNLDPPLINLLLGWITLPAGDISPYWVILSKILDQKFDINTKGACNRSQEPHSALFCALFHFGHRNLELQEAENAAYAQLEKQFDFDGDMDIPTLDSVLFGRAVKLIIERRPSVDSVLEWSEEFSVRTKPAVALLVLSAFRNGKMGISRTFMDKILRSGRHLVAHTALQSPYGTTVGRDTLERVLSDFAKYPYMSTLLWKFRSSLTYCDSWTSEAALSIAIANGDSNGVRLVLDAGFQPTSLCFLEAAAKGNIDVLRHMPLPASSADDSPTNSAYRTLRNQLMPIALREGHKKVFRFITTTGPDFTLDELTAFIQLFDDHAFAKDIKRNSVILEFLSFLTNEPEFCYVLALIERKILAAFDGQPLPNSWVSHFKNPTNKAASLLHMLRCGHIDMEIFDSPPSPSARLPTSVHRILLLRLLECRPRLLSYFLPNFINPNLTFRQKWTSALGRKLVETNGSQSGKRFMLLSPGRSDTRSEHTKKLQVYFFGGTVTVFLTALHFAILNYCSAEDVMGQEPGLSDAFVRSPAIPSRQRAKGIQNKRECALETISSLVDSGADINVRPPPAQFHENEGPTKLWMKAREDWIVPPGELTARELAHFATLDNANRRRLFSALGLSTNISGYNGSHKDLGYVLGPDHPGMAGIWNHQCYLCPDTAAGTLCKHNLC